MRNPAFAFAVALVLATTARAAAQSYTVTELPCLPGTFRAFVSDMNEQPAIVGTCDDEIVVWEQSGVRPIGLRGGGQLFINNRGVVSGTQGAVGSRQMFEWAGGVFRQLPQPPGVLNGLRGRTENEILLVDTDLATWALLGNAIYDLSALTGGASVSSVNELGTIAGQLSATPYLRFLDGRIVRSFPGVAGAVQAVGPNGHFAGITSVEFLRRFFVGSPGGTSALVAMAPTRFAGVNAINGRGDFVGFASNLAGFPSAVVYSGGQLLALDTTLDAPYTIVSANGINDAGQIAATGRLTSGGPIVALVLTPRAPLAPQTFTFSVAGRTVTLGWQPSIGAIDYILEAGTAPGLSNAFNGNVGAVTGLSVAAPPGRYYVRVRARNGVGISPPSNEVVIEVP